MITQRHRFHGQASLARVYQHGSTARATSFNGKYLWRDERRPYRVAVVVSKKVSKSAVVRNRIRRRMYELVRQLDPPLPNGLDFVIMVYSEDVADQPHDQLQTALTSLLQKAYRTKNEQNN